MESVIRECLLKGYFFHSAGTVDSLWIDLRKFRNHIVEKIEDISSCMVKILEACRRESTIDTVMFFNNEAFGLDASLDVSDILRKEVEGLLKNPQIRTYLCSITRFEIGELEMPLLKLEQPYGYQAAIFFPTSFHSPIIYDIINILKEKRHICVKAIIFLISRENDFEAKKFTEVPCYSLFKIQGNKATFDKNYLIPMGGRKE